MSKRYYWLRLKKDFFTDKRIKKLRKIAGGDTYTIIYLKMQLLSLQDEGVLYYDGLEDTFEEEIALQIDEEIEDTRITIGFLLSSGLMVKLDENAYELVETKSCIGSEAESTIRVRKLRTKNKLLGIPGIDEKRYGGNGLKVLERDGYKCAICGSTENICIHHKNGMSNDVDDLITLCRKCHSIEESKIKSVTCNENETQMKQNETKMKLIVKEKEKEIVKERYFNNEDVNNIFEEFLQVRKKLKAVNSDRAIKSLINKLEKYDDETKYKMIEQSIIKSWKDVYELKEKTLPTWFDKKQDTEITKEEQSEINEILDSFN